MTNSIRIKKSPNCVSGFNLKKKMMLFCVLFSLSQVDGYAVSSKRTTTSQNVQQQKSITGQVNDENGLPLPGVTILEKGTKNAVLTDFDGKFSLKNRK